MIEWQEFGFWLLGMVLLGFVLKHVRPERMGESDYTWLGIVGVFALAFAATLFGWVLGISWLIATLIVGIVVFLFALAT